jgi:hypothetical protein
MDAYFALKAQPIALAIIEIRPFNEFLKEHLPPRANREGNRSMPSLSAVHMML